MSKPTIDMCKVCILGAAGGIGRNLALLLKLNKYITDIALFDIQNVNGIREDILHIDTNTRVEAYSGTERKTLIEALKCSSLVVILASEANTSKTVTSTRDHNFDANAQKMVDIMKATVCACSRNMPFIHVVSNPVNTLVPLCGEYLKQLGCFDKRKLAGSTSVDSLRARTFLGQLVECDPSKLVVPVVGGHSADSITPLVSQSKPDFKLDPQTQRRLEDRIINGAAEVLNAKYPKDVHPQLAIAHSTSKFCNSVCRAIYGEKDVVEVGFIPADVNELEYFACNFSMDNNGITNCHRLPPMSDYEITLYQKAIRDVQKNITKAKDFLREKKSTI